MCCGVELVAVKIKCVKKELGVLVCVQVCYGTHIMYILLIGPKELKVFPASDDELGYNRRELRALCLCLWGSVIMRAGVIPKGGLDL